jgi:WD40 repeat protein
VNIYAIGASATPTASYPLTVESTLSAAGTTLGITNFDASTTVSVIDLSGATPAKVDYTPPLQYAQSYAATTSSHWIVANASGVVLDGSSLPGPSRLFDYGEALSIAGGTGHYAVATAAGAILYFNSATNALEGEINFPSSNIALSSDGTILAAQADPTVGAASSDLSARVYSLPSGALLATFPFTSSSSPTLAGLTFAAGGSVLGEELTNPDSQQTVPIAGGMPTVIPGAGGQQLLQLSPDGTRAAVSNLPAEMGGGQTTTTSLYLNGTLTTSLTGWALGWLDNGRLLVNIYETKYGHYVGAAIYSPTGTLLQSPTIPELLTFQVVTPQLAQPDLMYAPRPNTIISLSSGATQWTSGSPTDSDLLRLHSGAVAGSNIVFVSGDQLLSEPY